ncbi:MULTISPECIES: pantetheine-phosphate adenylyltransferase [Francisella]|uniref:Phosphopantetheine adenylyltransferase n=1 Tax=Francisella opportunistica TaxID=2016517 RepID=A0A345JS14_9GAMM|nr:MULTISPECIES: pantetheine-phosphate adenylyltransferase [Francisella]APC91869.1 Phosphopantetheine adenylyltransferase [Francisella sp. MA067296]AXH30110.1 pantetheine-phosphate adenylyltransferase [Francisella opportunistica]AXH31753.1 pantetheine-phosphate adenylyltransferase [Francisella opportunistica]AXH33400.1 pantetheine-phosphate adenylyltransferase [Francisella opportunistica]
MNKVAIYPGTFDPITNGHVDLVDRALNIFDQIVVAVSTASGKNTLFDICTREQMIKEVFKDNHRVKVVSFQGLLVDTAAKHNVCAIVRGLRAVSDFDYEFQMSSMNNKLNSNIQTIFLTPSEKFSCISSTLIRAVAIHNYKRVDEFVPECVFREIKLKYSKE